MQGAQRWGVGGWVVEPDDPVRIRVKDFSAGERAVDDEVRGFIKDDVGFGTVLREGKLAFDGEAAPEFEIIQRWVRCARLLHGAERFEGLVVGAMKLASGEVEDSNLPVGEGKSGEV